MALMHATRHRRIDDLNGARAPFKVGQVLSLLKGVPLYKNDTYGQLLPLTRFMTGLEPPFEQEPDVDQTEAFLTYATWWEAIREACTTSLYLQMVEQYGQADNIGFIGSWELKDGEDCWEAVDRLIGELSDWKIDIDQQLNLLPLTSLEREAAEQLYCSDGLWARSLQCLRDEMGLLNN